MSIRKKLFIALLTVSVIVLIIIGGIVVAYINATGNININTTISGGIPFYTEATFNGNKISIPYKASGLKPGEYTLTINRTDVKNKTQKIVIKRFQTTNFTFELQPISGQEIIDEPETQ
jgi:hypothetical protein